MKEKEIAVELVATKILLVRGRKVMLDRDLAQLYGVAVKRLNEQVKRNIRRFPEDFMFQLSWEEVEASRSQNATLKENVYSKRDTDLKSQIATSSWGGVRKAPFVFTEQGVAMLSSVLNSERAIEVNIAIMRAFVRMREILLTNKDLAVKIEALELKYKNHDLKLAEYDKHIGAIFEAIKQLMAPEVAPEKPKIGFHQ
ncbi:MAG: ORF6N domain-containing protein [Candidatus Omnitrophica bacterium]|nr:ORF6N domain-containing protein [Candidatus Omnitrophota bacterium]